MQWPSGGACATVVTGTGAIWRRRWCAWRARRRRWAWSGCSFSVPLRGATRYPSGLPNNIPARVYARSAAEETIGMADRVLDLVQRKLHQAE
jgi:hypothetical protein